MTHKEMRRTTWKKFGTLSVLGLAALSLMPQCARADNDDYNAPVYSQSRDNDVDYDNDGARLSQFNQRITIRGTVQSDGRGNVFTLRIDNSRTVTVYSRYEPPRLSRGDLVEASGFLDRRNNRFTADSVRVVRDNDNNNGYNQTVRGTVTDERRSQNAFIMRASDGRAYLVDTRRTNQPNIQRGQTVEVRGRLQGSSLLADSVRIVSGNNNGSYGNNVMTGRVTRDYYGRDFELRTENGRSVTVRARREPIRLSRGDVVEVRGEMGNGIFQADTVRILRNNDNNGNANRVNFTGTVQRGGTGSFTVRADNGRDYTVQNSNVSVGFGDRVRVAGNLNRDVVTATQVTVADRNNGNNGNNNNQGDFMRFDGRVRQVGNGFLIVRDESKDQDRMVRTNNARAFNTGDRVRVEGYHRNGQVNATSISRR